MTHVARRIVAAATFVLVLLATTSIVGGQVNVGRFTRLVLANGSCQFRSGPGTPEGAIVGSVCDIYLRSNGGTGTVLYVKESGSNSTTGWVALSAPSGGVTVTSGQLVAAEYNAGNSATALTIDWNNSNEQRLVLTGNATLTLSNPVAGGRYLLVISQDATGSRTITWPAAVKWTGGTAPTLTTTASGMDICTFRYTEAGGGVYAGACNLDIR